MFGRKALHCKMLWDCVWNLNGIGNLWRVLSSSNGNPIPCSCLENPRDGEPGGLLSMGSHRVRHD